MQRLGVLLLLSLAAIGSASAADLPSQKFVVFFQEWSASIDDSAQAVIGKAAEWVKSHPGNVAHVHGFASTVGSRRANVLLSDLRAQVVADQLVTDGVNAKSIRERGRGPVEFALTPQESRRVEIGIERH